MKNFISILLLVLTFCACSTQQQADSTVNSQNESTISQVALSKQSLPSHTSISESENSDTIGWEYLPSQKYPLGYSTPWGHDASTLLKPLENPIRQKNSPLTEDEAKELLKSILPLGMRLSQDLLLYIMEADQSGDGKGGSVKYIYEYDGHIREYYLAKPTIYESISGMKALAEQAFTLDCCMNLLYPYAFIDYPPSYIESEGKLYALGNETMSNGMYYEWQIDTLRLVSQNQNEIIVEMKYCNRAFDEDIYWYRGKVRLISENGLWKIDSTLVSFGDCMGNKRVMDEEETGIENVENYLDGESNR